MKIKKIPLLVHILALALVTLLVGFTWSDIQLLSIRADGFVYLLQRFRENYWMFPAGLFSLEGSSFLMSQMFVPWFTTNVQQYLLLEFLIILLVAGMFYAAVYFITKNIFIALSSAIIQSINYLGNWGLYTGWYAYVFERLPGPIILLPSFILLHQYLDKRKKKFLSFSLTIYFLAIGLWHWNLLLAGLFIFYPTIYSLYNKKRNLRFNIFISALYLSISYFYVFMQNMYQSNFGGSSDSLIKALSTHGGILGNIDLMLRQLSYWSQYLAVTSVIISNLISYPQHILSGTITLSSYFSSQNAQDVQPIIVALYLGAAVLIYKILPKLRACLLTVIFATLSTFFLNIYIGQYQVQFQSGPNRYLAMPTFTLAIFWALFLYSLIKKYQKIGWTLSVSFLILYIFISTLLIKNNFFHVLPSHKIANDSWSYIVSNQSKWEDEVIILGREFGGYEAEFLNNYFGSKTRKHYTLEEYSQSKVPADKKQIIVGFDQICKCVKETLVENSVK